MAGAVTAVLIVALGSGGAVAHPLPSVVPRAVAEAPLASFSVKTVKVGDNPIDATFDPKNGDVYVVNSNSSSVSVINGSTNKVTKTITVAAGPIEAAYDSVNGDVYVLSQTTPRLTVLSNSNSILKTITLVANPTVAEIAPSGTVYVTCHAASILDDGDVAVINASTNSVKELGIGEDGGVPYFDPANGDVYVVNVLSANISAISSALKVKSISLGSGTEPIAMVYSPATKDMYVTMLAGDKIDAISSANKIVAKIADPNVPYLPTYDSVNQDLYVVDEPGVATSNLTVVSKSNAVVETLTIPRSEVFGWLDTENGDFYLGTITGKVLVFNSAATPALVKNLSAAKYPLFTFEDPSTNDVWVLCYAATATASSVYIFSSANAHLATEKVGDGGITLTFDSTNGDYYVADYGTDTVSVVS